MNSDWKEYEIDELGEVVTGSTPSTKVLRFWNGEYPFYSPFDIGTKKICLTTEKTITKAGLKSGRILPLNSILFTCIGSTIGKIAITGKTGISNQQINAVLVINYLFQFNPLLVKRDERYFKILNKNTFEDFLLNESPTIGEALNGEKRLIKPRQEDIDTLLPFCYFNARLVPKHGTVESRMCCQQPPTETLTSAALTLGIIENLEAAEDLARKFPIETWREIRKKASQYTFNAHINEFSILPSIQNLLDIANEGLKKRNLQEEVFLQPLYERLEQRKSPADVAIEIFNTGGMKALLEHVSFNEEAYNEIQTLDQATLAV